MRINGNAQAATGSDTARILQFNIAVNATPLAAKNKRFSGLLAKINADESLKTQLAESRAWVAETFHSDNGDTIKSLRLKKGWSQQEFAALLSTTQAQVARIEKGNTDPMRSTCKRLREVLGISAEKLDEIMDRQEAIFHSRNEK